MITLNTPAPIAHSGILGLGTFRPERVVTNDEICLRIDSNDECAIDADSGATCDSDPDGSDILQ